MNLEIIKNIQLPTYLKSIGFEPKNQHGNKLFYTSPFRPEEKTPSFVVRIKQNDFKCYSSTFWGDIIKFVELYHDANFKEALEHLQSFDGTAKNDFSFSVCKIEPSHSIEEKPFQLKKVKPLENKALIQYLTERKINHSLAKYHLKEAYYNEKQFALAFENDLGGFELRNRLQKFSTSPKTITSIKGKCKTAVMLFEGFMDFLSYLTIIKNDIPEFDTIVLNSVSNINLASDLLTNYSKIFSVLDNDPKGIETLNNLKTDFKNQIVIDCSKRYEGFKDLNDFLINRK